MYWFSMAPSATLTGTSSFLWNPEKMQQLFGRTAVFLGWRYCFRAKCENSSLAPRFCVAKSNPCGILKVRSVFFLQLSFQQLRTNLPVVSSAWRWVKRWLPPPANLVALSSNKRICSGLTTFAFGVVGRDFVEKLPQVLEKPTVFLGGGRFPYQVWEFLPCSQILRSKIESVWHPKGSDWIGGFRHLPDFGLRQEIALERKTHWDSGGWAGWLGCP